MLCADTADTSLMPCNDRPSDVLELFFDVDRMSRKPHDYAQMSRRHVNRYVTITLVTVIEQACRLIVWEQEGRPEQRDPGSFEFANFQSTRVIAGGLDTHGIRGVFDGKDGRNLRDTIDGLLAARHDLMHTAGYVEFKVQEWCKATKLLVRRIMEGSVLKSSSDVDVAEARYELNHGNHAEAVRLLYTVIDSYDVSHTLLFNKGVAYSELEDYGMAEQCLAEALEGNPADHRALALMGAVKGAIGRHDEELVYYERALAVKSDDTGTLSNMVAALVATGRRDEAAACVERMTDDSPFALLDRGEALARIGHHEEALECTDMALVRRQGDPAALLARGAILAELGRHEEALGCYGTVMDAWPGNSTVLLNLGVTMGRLGRYDEALKYTDMSLAVHPDFPEALLNRGTTLAAQGRHA